MLLQYVKANFITLMILSGLIAAIVVNRRNNIPATRYFHLTVIIIFLITVTNTITDWAAGDIQYQFFSADPSVRIATRTVATAIGYILMPLPAMIQVMITNPVKSRKKWLVALPAALNAVVYTFAIFGSRAAFWITDNNQFRREELGLTIYFVMLFYVFMLALFSVIYFKSNENTRSAIVLLIVIQSIIVAAMEGTNTLLGFVTPVSALGTLEYYFYLSVIYQSEMRETIAEKELNLTRQQMTLLRNQIQPHFIFNSLSIIRSLARRDSKKAVECIDSFSEYLKAHIYFIQDDELVTFDKELDNVRAYLDLVQSDSVRNVKVEYDLGATDFMIPPLTLEPIVENAIKHGIGFDGGTVTIRTYEQDDASIITVSDSGKGETASENAEAAAEEAGAAGGSAKAGAATENAKAGAEAGNAKSSAAGENAKSSTANGSAPDSGMTEKEKKRLGIGIANTRRRLKMQCDGTLNTEIGESGSVVTITIPHRK